jgi:ubiquinol-cytochrome c reductase cytochrome c subunit
MALMNRSTRIVSLALATAAAALLCVHAAAAQTTPPAGDATRGKAAFMKYGCYECHGTVAQGNYNGIPHLAPHPLPEAALIGYIRRPSGQMPSYSAAILPDKDAADIWAYLASIPAGKTAAEIPALSAISTKSK